MKIVCISDTHGHFAKAKIPRCDLLLHAGDISMQGHPQEVEKFLREFERAPAIHKVFIAGNHDFLFQKDPALIREMLQEYPEIHYLENSGVEIEGIKIWGSPNQPWFYDWAFNFSPDVDSYRQEAQETWGKIPDDTDILLTHGPPYGILDQVSRLIGKEVDSSVGCKYLLDRILQINPTLHVFGHIHEAYGEKRISAAQTTFVNAAFMTLKHDGHHDPIVFEDNELFAEEN